MNFKKIVLLVGLVISIYTLNAQSFTWISSTEGNVWKETKARLQSKQDQEPLLKVDGTELVHIFKRWGTCFNELGWDALNLLPLKMQDAVLTNFFSPDGDLRFSMGRIPMNANDYARDWYSCDEVPGDFQLKYFNIDRDKKAIIPFIKRAKRYNPDMTFWASPWSPPSWMKVNHYYSVRSSSKVNQLPPEAEVALYENTTEKDLTRYPRQLTVNDFFIQDPRYLQAYANYFCKFISSYRNEDIVISKVMFQNEPWAYPPYPGCAWTPEGIVRFNVEYLAPTLKKQHSDVSLYLGTLNTNRLEEMEKILSDPRMPETVEGLGLQWWSGQILPEIRKKYPHYKYMQTESECGSGTFDWKAAEHTFHLINRFLGNGCEEYTFWNAILSDEGSSAWGWKQNALVRVDSKTSSITYTPEYYAVKHFSNKVVSGTKVLQYKDKGEDKLPVIVFLTPENKYLVVAGNFNDDARQLTVQLGDKYLNVTLQAHSFNTFCMK
ncbi:MAG: beta-glycosidase [Paludibacter sp.]|nr:beta-glycosidase [Paludibacter sp.]MDD4428409.1 beta-glycosidase [Paludibacter sp.]